MSCPFCGNDELDIEESQYWSGMRYITLAYNARHFCKSSDFDKRIITLRGKTKEDILRLWNQRSEVITE